MNCNIVKDLIPLYIDGCCSEESEKVVEETFNGSLPKFLAAFSTRKKLSDSEIEELKKLIDEMR